MSLPTTPCVFLVDDDEDDRFLVQRVFQHYSPECSLRLLESGAQLLAALSESPVLPSLVLLDINMPRMSGLEVLALVRQQARYETLPVVILTTSNDQSDRTQAAGLGAAGFMTKPSTIEGLNHLVLQLRQRWLLGRCRPLSALSD